MTAREFLEWALGEEYDMEEALFQLGRYTSKGGSYFVSFPDADVLDEEGNLLSESAEEPAGFQEYWDDYLRFEGQIRPGRPALPPDEKRKPRSIKMTDAEWEEIQHRAAQEEVSAAEYIRRKTLAGD